VKFCQFVASVYLHRLANFGRFILIEQNGVIFSTSTYRF